MEMRKATLKDYETFNNMYTIFFARDEGDESHKIAPMAIEKYQDLVNGEGIYLAILNEEVMGFAILFAYEDVGCEIYNMFIKEKCRGYGAQFYNLLEEEIRESNIDRVFVRIYDVVDFRSEKFWWKRGFRSVNGSGELEKWLNN